MVHQNKEAKMDKIAFIFSIVGLLLLCVVVGIIPAFIGFILSIICLTRSQKYNKKLAISSLVISIITGMLFFVILIYAFFSGTENTNDPNLVSEANSFSSAAPSESLEPTPIPTATPTPVPTATPTPVPTATPENNSSSSTTANNNFDTYNNPQQQQTSDTYVLNTRTMRIHYPHCSSVKKIAPDNYATSSETLEALKAKDYKPCGICFK